MTAAPADPPTVPARPQRQSKQGTCAVCGRGPMPLVPVARDVCWRDYARRRRELLAPPATQQAREAVLDLVADAHRRFRQAIDTHTTRRRELRGTITLAYVGDANGKNGLSIPQISEATGLAPTTVDKKYLPAELTAARHVAVTGHFGGDRAPPEVVDRWRPALQAAAEAVEEARDQRRDTSRAFTETLQDAISRADAGRVRQVDIARHLQVSRPTVGGWLAGQVRTGPDRETCTARRADGGPCGSYARIGHSTCYWHRDQEPTGA